MVIVYCGGLWHGSTCRMRMEALERTGHTVIGIDTSWCPDGAPARLKGLLIRAIHKAGWTVDAVGANQALIGAVEGHRPEVVWIDKGLSLETRTLHQIRRDQPGARLVHYSPDDMGGKHNQSPRYLTSIPLYDLHVTTKSFNVPELYARRARAVLFLDNAYCPCTHKPVVVDGEERARLGGSVGFIGAFEEERAEAMRFVAENGVLVRIWGNGWGGWARTHPDPNLRVENRPLWGEQYARAICSFDVNLGFLRKLNRDVQTTRSVEIPACDGFLLAERADEHLKLFEEGVEAEFFGGRDELLEKCRYYLAHPAERRKIAVAGGQRCRRSDYSYDRHVTMVLEQVERTNDRRVGKHA